MKAGDKMAEMVRLIEQGEFGAYLKEREKASGLRGQDFCLTLGISRVAYSRLLNGHAQPSQDVLNALSVRIAYVDDSQPADAKSAKKAKAKKGTIDHEHRDDRKSNRH